MDINTFLTNFNGGTRLNRFMIEAQNPDSIGPKTEMTASTGDSGTATGGRSKAAFNGVAAKTQSPGSFPIHIRATKFPELSMGVIPVNYRGKTILFPGERQLNNWEIIVLDDIIGTTKNLHLHRAFMDWSKAIVPTDGRLGVKDFSDATGWANGSAGNVWKITQLSHSKITDTSTNPDSLRSVVMYNCWPKEVGPLQLDMSTDNAINYFRVVLSYSHMDPISS